jgi:UDP-3-O-[3-hydroxymyristoyl] glucosamine N-acyltransferase
MMPTFSLQHLADLVGGSTIGDPETPVCEALPQNDVIPGCITLADSKQQAEKASLLPASAVVVAEHFENCNKPLLIVKDIHMAFIQLVLQFRPSLKPVETTETQIAASAIVEPSAQIGIGSQIGPHVTIGRDCKIGRRCVIHAGVSIMENCEIGDDCELYPGCVLYNFTRIGQRVLIHSNAVLGAFGFGYRHKNGGHHRTAQLGWVEIGDDVEIGAGTTIDRGTYGSTRIGCGTKIDNQVQIGHNCHIGQHNLICAQVGIAGSCTVGDFVVMGGQVGLADHLTISDHARIGAKSGLMSNVGAGETVLGSPAAPIKQKMLEWAVQGKLPEMRKELRALIARVEELESSQSLKTRREAA